MFTYNGGRKKNTNDPEYEGIHIAAEIEWFEYARDFTTLRQERFKFYITAKDLAA
jgi:hypothetical protein